MLLRHATHWKYVESIVDRGLLVDKATGRLKATWYHPAEMTGWAIAHVARRHGWSEDDIVIIECSVPDEWLTRDGRGVYYVRRNLPPQHIHGVYSYAPFTGEEEGEGA